MLSRRIKATIGLIMSPFIFVKKNRIAFVTKASVPFAGNLRAIADCLLAHGGHEIVIYKDGPIDVAVREALEAKGAIVLERYSLKNLAILLGAKAIFVSHSIRDAHIVSRKRGRNIINVWHGVAIKRIELLMEQSPGNILSASRKKLILENAKLYDRVLACNARDRSIMAGAFGVHEKSVVTAGLPRMDYLHANAKLPADLQEQEEKLLSAAAGRKIVFYAPTFREAGISPFAILDSATVQNISAVCNQFNLVFAMRSHPYDLTQFKKFMGMAGDAFLDCSTENIGEPALLLRNAGVLITDYSSIWVDFLLLDRPIIGLMHDLKQYERNERGFVNDIKQNFPGHVHIDWVSVLNDVVALAKINFAVQQLENPDKLARIKNDFLPAAGSDNYSQELLNQLRDLL